MQLYLITTISLIAILLIYFRLADKYNIIDKPNQRSSHSTITIRGGGIVFPLAALLWFLFYGFQQPLMIAGLMAMAVVSFLDDVLTLSGKIRIVVHLLAVTLLFAQGQLFGLPWILIAAAYIITIGWINAFNFMDGINGIAVLYGLVSLATFYYLNLSLAFASDDLLILLILSSVIFSWFNLRKRARCFAGDVGSVTMAFLLAWFLLGLMMKTGRVEYILFFAVYGIDSVVTILYRLWRRENIFEAHRTHLYQYLSNELKWPHVAVSAVYAGVQLAINLLTILLIHSGQLTVPLLCGLLLLFGMIYLIFRIIVLKKIQVPARRGL